ncbi:hypothetical protein [Zhongshania sp.]|uniref:hypothetical protein n=1 Tax=Zhongshania sp. TaxID=1971902 RepID=UPI0035683556
MQGVQLKRARPAEKFIQVRLGRIMCDLQRRLRDQDELAPLFAETLRKANIALRQERNSKVKLYSEHAPEVECIARRSGPQLPLAVEVVQKAFLVLNLLTFICSRLRNSVSWARHEITVLNQSAPPMIFSMSIMG